MVKIISKTSLFRNFYLLIILLITTACTSFKIATVRNNTDDSIHFRGQFITKYDQIDNLDFVLKPGDINSWTYEIGYFENDILDKGLNNIILSNTKGCAVTLERNAIENIAKRNGMWEIKIDKNIMNCD